MKFFSLIIFLLISLSSIAEDYRFNSKVEVISDSKGIQLKGADCKTLEKEAAALAAWTKKVNESVQPTKCSCTNGTCTQVINTMLPAFAKNKQFKKSKNDGPNCWNATLVASKLVPQVRYTSQEEMYFWMTSPLCREKKMSEPLSPGDIIAIRDGDQGEVHGFVHISDNLSFSKNGFDSSMSYSLQDPKFVFETYNVPDDCQRKTGEPEECHTWANYYTCQTMDQYLAKNPIKDKSLKDAFTSINQLECQISDMAFGGSMKPITDLQFATLQIIKKLAYNSFNSKKHKPEEKIIWEGIYVKCQALEDQLSIFKTVGG